MKQGRERVREQGMSEMKRPSRARYHEDKEGKQEQCQRDSQGARRQDSSLSTQSQCWSWGDMDHEEEGEERGLPTLCRCQPPFPEPAGITQQEVDEAAK